MKPNHFLAGILTFILFSVSRAAPSADQSGTKERLPIRPEVLFLLKKAADTYGGMASFQCRGVFQNESGFADAFNMTAIESQLDSIQVEKTDREKVRAISKEISTLLDRAEDASSARTNKAMELNSLPPSSAESRKLLIANIRALLQRLSIEAPSAKFNDKEALEPALAALGPAYGSYSLAMARPYKVGFRTNTPALLSGSLFNDAVHLTLVDDQQREYIQQPALLSLHKIVSEYSDFFGMNPHGKLFAKTALQDKDFMALMQKATLLETDLGGNIGPVDVLVAKQESELGGVVRIYFDRRRHLIRKYSLDTPLLSTTETIEDISIDQPIPQDLFHFKPGANFKRVSQFTKSPGEK